jgi:hypothetical protein
MSIHEWNNKVLAAKGVKHKAIAPKVVRSVGDAKRATLYDGTVVERTDAIFVDGYGLVRCAPYELHFIYEVPSKMKGWKYYCTCGSLAGCVGYGVYSTLITPSSNEYILVCVRHMATKQNTGIGVHADLSSE